MKKFKTLFFTIAIAIVLIPAAASSVLAAPIAAAPALKEKPLAKAAYLMEYSTGTELFAYNPSARLPIASMVKIMTAALSFEHVESGKITLDTMIAVSPRAASMGGSQAFLDANSQYNAADLIKSIIVASANDSCVAMAEEISGSIEGFVDLMNEKARSLGCTDTNFVNCTGLPAPGAYSSARDVAVMTRELIKHPDFFKFSTIWMEDLVHPGGRVTGLTNTNKLVRFYEGCDGGKTGFTSDALFCLSATAKRNGLRLISVIISANDSKVRFAEVSKLLNFGFANYENKVMVLGGQELQQAAPVKNGREDEVKLRAKSELGVFGLRGKAAEDIKIVEEITPLTAPVEEGACAGKIRIVRGGEVIAETDIITASAVGKRGYRDILADIFGEM